MPGGSGSVNVGGIPTDTTAAITDILSGKTAYITGQKQIGTMPSKVGSALIITPSTVNQTIPKGYFDGVAGSGQVLGDGNLVPVNIAPGVTIFGVTGAVQYKKYGVQIDITNSNPLTSVTYTDDAIGMSPAPVGGGVSAWDSLFPYNLIKLVMLKAGIEQYDLDPTNLAKKKDGTASDITSGNDGDVMAYFPKTAYSIVTSGNYIYVKITNHPSPTNGTNENWHFYAHTRVTEGDKDKLYIGVYLGYNLSSKLRSLSGKTPTNIQTIGTFRTQAQANGAGYDQIGFYPLTLLQCLYLIRFKSLDSQTALGRGFVDGNSASITTGGTNAKGMNFGEPGGNLQMKFCGIEDFWGNLYCWIDGLYNDASRNILTAFQSFNDTGSGYTNRGQGSTLNINGSMDQIQGKSESGFIAKSTSGSNTTYWCDYGDLSANYLPFFGGFWGNASSAGAFSLRVAYAASYSNSSLGARLMFL